jgi:hypothetical protein
MDSFILEDVNSLLTLKKGDSNRLSHIKELCLANEIISLSDRKYIERLSSQYLRLNENNEPKKPDKPKFIAIEETSSPTQTEIEPQEDKVQTIHPKKLEKPTISSAKTLTKNLDFLSNKKIIYSLGTIVLAVILIAIVAIEYDGIQVISNGTPSSTTKPDLPITLESDESSYETSDIVSISGKIASPINEVVRVSIENEQGKLIWAENLDLKNNGEFSTLALAGGIGWEKSGEYILMAEHDNLIEKISFNFVA